MTQNTYLDYISAIVIICYAGGILRLILLLIQMIASQTEESEGTVRYKKRMKHIILFLIMVGAIDLISQLIKTYY